MEIKYLNKKHQKEVEEFMSLVKEVIYYATEDSATGKYSEFNNLIGTITTYSNNFYRSVKSNKGNKEEFAFMIPNLLFYMSIGFLTGIQKKNQEYNTMKIIKNLSDYATDVTGRITDILIDEEEKERRKELLNQ
jgi:transposase